MLKKIQEAVRDYPNRSELARLSGVSYGTLVNVAKGGDIMLSSAESLIPHLFPKTDKV